MAAFALLAPLIAAGEECALLQGATFQEKASSFKLGLWPHRNGVQELGIYNWEGTAERPELKISLGNMPSPHALNLIIPLSGKLDQLKTASRIKVRMEYSYSVNSDIAPASSYPVVRLRLANENWSRKKELFSIALKERCATMRQRAFSYESVNIPSWVRQADLTIYAPPVKGELCFRDISISIEANPEIRFPNGRVMSAKQSRPLFALEGKGVLAEVKRVRTTVFDANGASVAEIEQSVEAASVEIPWAPQGPGIYSIACKGYGEDSSSCKMEITPVRFFILE